LHSSSDVKEAMSGTINKPCVREAEYMRLIPWIHRRGSEHFLLPKGIEDLVFLLFVLK
jgi:hypothetical protein